MTDPISQMAELIYDHPITRLRANMPTHTRMFDEFYERSDRASAIEETRPLEAYRLYMKIGYYLKSYRNDLNNAAEAPDQEISNDERESIIIQANVITAILIHVADMRDRCERRILELLPPTQ